MNSIISDLALDLGVFALDSEIENGEMLRSYVYDSLPEACVTPA